MNLANTIRLQNLEATAAGTQATVSDSRSADEWIKKYLDDKNKRLNALRRELNHLIGPEKGEWHAAVREDKKTAFPQFPGRTAQGGHWAVVSPEDEIISTWSTKEEAYKAAFPYWNGLLPSATGPTGGARVKRVRDVRAADIFEDPEHGDRTRARFLKHPKPRAVQDADILRMADKRPSSHGQGAAGTGGAAGPGGGGT